MRLDTFALDHYVTVIAMKQSLTFYFYRFVLVKCKLINSLGLLVSHQTRIIP